jgi:CRP-like cAMP-binding protein
MATPPNDPKTPAIELTPQERTDLLEGTRWANEFAFHDLETLAVAMRAEKFPKAAFLCREGGTDVSMFVVVRGMVEVIKEDGKGSAKLLARLGPGQIIGEVSLVDGLRRSASVRAMEETTVLVMDRDVLDGLLKNHPRLVALFSFSLAKSLAARLRQTTGALSEFMRKV